MNISDFYEHLRKHHCEIEPSDSFSTPRIKIINTNNGAEAFLYGPFGKTINKGIVYSMCIKLQIPML